MKRAIYPPITPKVKRLLHGGDYNPDQWPRETWAEDDRLMFEAKWNAISLGIFSWVSLEPEEGKFTWDWMDEVMDIQAKSGRLVGLATPSAAQPAWLSAKYPEVLRTNADGAKRKHGNRVNVCWSSPVYREKTREMARRLAERYGNHPALAYWHVSNEFGGECYCERCRDAFQVWLQKRYGTLDKINAAYWNSFWGHTYTKWGQIGIPGAPHGEEAVTGLTLDWKRFCSDQIIECFLNEAGVLRAVAPHIPVTTNLMGTYPVVDGFKIAKHMDFIAWDSYPWFGSTPADIGGWAYTAFLHDLNRGLRHGQPFLLMECTPSSSNWYNAMALKRPNQHVLEGLQAIGHGSEGVQYFQWRMGRGGIEQYHGAVVAHNNRSDARVFKEVAELGARLDELTPVIGSTVDAKVALVFDWEVMWAIDGACGPRQDKKNYVQTVMEHYRPLWEKGVSVDIVDSDCDISKYKLVIAPMLYLIKNGVAERLGKFVENGGTLVTTYWSGWVDENTLAFQGGYPEPLRSALGTWTEEIDALYADQHNEIRPIGALLPAGATYTASELCELIHAETAEVLATYREDFYAGRPALTCNSYGKGEAYYVASRNEQQFTRDLLGALTKKLGIEPCVRGTWKEGVTIQCRQTATADYLFVLNCTDSPASVAFEESSLRDAFDGSPCVSIELPAFGSKILARELATTTAVTEGVGETTVAR